MLFTAGPEVYAVDSDGGGLRRVADTSGWSREHHVLRHLAGRRAISSTRLAKFRRAEASKGLARTNSS